MATYFMVDSNLYLPACLFLVMLIIDSATLKSRPQKRIKLIIPKQI